MKKLQIFIISLFLVFVLASCNQYNISEVLFIASVGIEKRRKEKRNIMDISTFP